MKKWTIVAYAECEGNYSLPRKEVEVSANTHEEAMNKAWRLFPEYHQLGAYEVTE